MDFACKGGARFEHLLERFGICTGAQEMLDGSVNFVTAYATFKTLDGVESDGFLDDQRYDSGASTATYALTFDLFGRSSARLLVRLDMRFIDLADLYEYSWERLRIAGLGDFWVSRINGADLDLTRFYRHISASSAKLLEHRWAQKVKMTVPADSIVETLDVIEHI